MSNDHFVQGSQSIESCNSIHHSPGVVNLSNGNFVQASQSNESCTSIHHSPEFGDMSNDHFVQGSPSDETDNSVQHSLLEDLEYATGCSSSLDHDDSPSMDISPRINLNPPLGRCRKNSVPSVTHVSRVDRIRSDYRSEFAWENLFQKSNSKQRNSENKIEKRQLENILLTSESVDCCATYSCTPKCKCDCMNRLRKNFSITHPDRTEDAFKDVIWSHRSKVLEIPQAKALRAKYVANQLYNMNQELYSNHDATGNSRLRPMLKICGIEVCKKVFCNISGISQHALKKALKIAKSDEGVLQKLCDDEIANTVDGQQVTTMRDWLLTHAKEGAACEMPTLSSVRDSAQSNSTEYRLYNNTKVAIWRIYADDIHATTSTPLSYSHFCYVWRKDPDLKQIRLMRKTENFGKCGLCEYFKSQLSKRLEKAERHDCRCDYTKHLGGVKYERNKYTKHVSKAIRKPSEYMSVCIDGMGAFATTQPHLNISSPKDIKGKDRLETQLIGVLVHGARMDFYAVTAGVKHGADVTVECLDQSIRKHLSSLQSSNKKSPRVLYIQLDNTTKDNKCETVFDYCAYLVHANLFDKVKVSFLKPGHTHIDIDQRFSVINKYLKTSDSNAVTWPRMQNAIRVAFLNSKMQVSSVPMVLEVRDWTTFLRDSCKKIGRFAKDDASGEAQHVFVFYPCMTSEGAVEVRMVYKEWHRCKVWSPKPHQVGDDVETSDGTTATIKGVSVAETPVAGALCAYAKKKKHEYKFTAMDVSGETIAWQEPPKGVLILNKKLDLGNLKLAPIPECWAASLIDVEKTIGYLKQNTTNALHSSMMAAGAVYVEGDVVNDYGDGSFLVRLPDKANAIHVDSERLVDLNSDTGKVIVNTEYPCAFTWWEQFFLDQRSRIKNHNERRCMTTPALDETRYDRKARGDISLIMSETEDDVTSVDVVTHENFTDSQRKQALKVNDTGRLSQVRDTRPPIGEICVAAFSTENPSENIEKYTMTTCPFQVLKHIEGTREFEVRWFYSKHQRYDNTHVWSIWKVGSRKAKKEWISRIKEESILVRRLETCAEKPKSLTGIERVGISSFKLKKASAEAAQKMEDTYSKNMRVSGKRCVESDGGESSDESESIRVCSKRRRIESSEESDSESSSGESMSVG